MKQKEIKYKQTKKFSEEVINEILEVEKEKGLTAKNLLEKAKVKGSKLYNFFEWDNSKAGVLFRLQQARVLINEIKVIVGEKEMYAFENITISILNNEEDFSEKVYKPLQELMSNSVTRKMLVDRALREIAYWEERNKNLKELAPIFVSIGKVNKKWQKNKK